MTFEEFVKKYNIIDPYSNIYPDTKYDYISAWKAGVTPNVYGKWPSEFKYDDSPERYDEYGRDTKNLKGDSMPHDMEDYMNENFRIQRPGEELPGPTWRDTKMVEPQNAHENIDTLIEVDDNKDYYELLDKITRFTPMGLGQNIKDISGRFEGQHGGVLDQLSALINQEEQDPVGPQGLRFSEYMKIRPFLNRLQTLQKIRKEEVRSIAEEHANNLTKQR